MTSLMGEAALIEHIDLVTDRGQRVQAVGDEYHRHFLFQRFYQVQHKAFVLPVEGGRGFVEDQ